MGVGKGYRVPKLEEFVQDFEYEYKFKSGGGGIWTNGKLIYKIPASSEWFKQKVWWLPRNREEAKRTTVYEDGTSITWFINPNFDKPYDIRSMLEQNLLRVKIKGYGNKE